MCDAAAVTTPTGPPRPPRKHTAVRLGEGALAEVDRIAAAEERTRADVLRRVLQLGLAAYKRQAGQR